MPRPERPLDPESGPVTAFAVALRRLRHDAGSPTYRQLAQRVHFSPTTLSYAASGYQLPSLDVTLAYVRACDGDVDVWRKRWSAVALEVHQPAPPGSDDEPPHPTTAPDPTDCTAPGWPRWLSRGVTTALAGAVVAATAWHVAGVRSRRRGNARRVVRRVSR